DFGWTEGVNNLYTVLAQDFVYKDPMRNVIFLDNHDMARFYSVVGEDMDKYKTAINWLLTCRGIPQFYYGGEIGMTGTTSPNDGYVRQDFMGGWKEDKVNKFTAAGRSAKENEIWDHVSTLANYRKRSSAITTGKMMQFVPQDGMYVYFRYDDKQTVMVAMNTAKENKTVVVNKFGERTKGFSKMKNIFTGEVSAIKDIKLDPYKSNVFELMK
ncbi:MAG: cyclomaltodextrinase C-terminal domain-containing protein, partial [Ferruginibacter sp.]